MSYKEYVKGYINFYNMIIDITKEIKDFLYPNEYDFNRIDSDLPLGEQLELIKNDLESMRFEKEVEKTLLENLHYLYPSQEKELDELSDMMYMYLMPQVTYIKDNLNKKYLPFLKLMEIKKERHNDPSIRDSDEDLWHKIISNKGNVESIEDKISDVIWALMDNSKEDIVNNFLREAYKLDDIEFNRYMNGSNKASSIIKKHENSRQIKANFKLFDRYFNDIYGQDLAIEKIRKTLLRNILFYNATDVEEKETVRNSGPLATFMFYGPTGTGKTETAKRIADFVFGDERQMLIMDMNAYKDPRVSSSAIKGHPEGYVDSAKGTDFTRFLTANKQGIIVLDEFEKASSEVREIFMTMLDEGKFRDALGNVYDLSGYIFIATTNVSKVFEDKPRVIGFQVQNQKEIIRNEENRIREELRKVFTAPIMNRFNELVGFNEIKKEDAIAICNSLISKLVTKFESKSFNGICPKITISNEEEIIEIILEESNFKKDGVRSLKNVINDIIGSKILEEIVDENDNIEISAKNGEIIVCKNIKESVFHRK